MPHSLLQLLEKEKRFSQRVRPPAHLVKEFAIWFMPSESRKLEVQSLGLPHQQSINGDNRLSIENISCGGMSFSLPVERLRDSPQFRIRHCYVYLKLRSANPAARQQQLFLLLGLSLLHMRTCARTVRVEMCGKFTTRALAARDSKSFQIFHVERSGVRELSVWGEELQRMGRGIMPPVAAGVDMEYLLLELAAARATASAAAP